MDVIPPQENAITSLDNNTTLSGDGNELVFNCSHPEDSIRVDVTVKLESLSSCFPKHLSDLIYLVPDLDPISQLLNGDEDAEFVFGCCTTTLKIYSGVWGVRRRFIVELLYNPIEYSQWPNREEMASYLLDRRSLMIQNQLAFICERSSLESFERGIRQFFPGAPNTPVAPAG